MEDGFLKKIWGGALAYKGVQHTEAAQWQLNALVGHDDLLNLSLAFLVKFWPNHISVHNR